MYMSNELTNAFVFYIFMIRVVSWFAYYSCGPWFGRILKSCVELYRPESILFANPVHVLYFLTLLKNSHQLLSGHIGIVTLLAS